MPPGADPAGAPLLLWSPSPPPPPAVPKLPPPPPPPPPLSFLPLVAPVQLVSLAAAPLRPLRVLDASSVPGTVTESLPTRTSARAPITASDPDTVTVVPAITHRPGPPLCAITLVQLASIPVSSGFIAPGSVTVAAGGASRQTLSRPLPK